MKLSNSDIDTISYNDRILEFHEELILLQQENNLLYLSSKSLLQENKLLVEEFDLYEKLLDQNLRSKSNQKYSFLIILLLLIIVFLIYTILS